MVTEGMPHDEKSKNENYEESENLIDFSWILFVGTKMLGFTEKEVGYFTFKKWTLLYKHFKCCHNFFMKQALFKEEKSHSSK